MSKSHSLNLWNVEDSSTKLDIDVSPAKVNIAVTGSQPIVINPPLKLIDSVGGDIDSVSTKLHDIDAAIAAGNAGSAAASALVQQNLTAYETSNNAALATLNATVVSNKSISDAAQIADSDARTALQNTLQSAIDDEEARAIAAEGVLTSSLATEVTNRQTAVSDEATARAAADATLTANLASAQAQIDGILAGSSIDLDSFAEVVTQYSSLNTDALAQIANLNTSIVAIQAQLAELTSSSP